MWDQRLKILNYALLCVILILLSNASFYFIKYVWTGQDILISKPNLEIFLFSLQVVFIFVVLVSFIRGNYTEYDISDSIETSSNETSEKDIWYKLKLEDNETRKETNSHFENDNNKWIEFKKAINETVRLFYKAWLFCWLNWGLLYTSIILEKFGILSPDSTIPLLFNNFSSLMFLLMFLSLSRKTRKNNKYKKFTFIGVISIILINGLFTIVKDPDFLFLYLVITSFFASVSMALFFGSLNSFFTRIPLSIVICLHFYAALQIFFIFESNMFLNFLDIKDDTIKSILVSLMNVVYSIALLSKILLFLTVGWILQTARLTFSITQRKSANNANEEDELLKETTEKVNLKTVKLKTNRLLNNLFG